MRIAGLQKLSLLDFPSYTSCTLFTPACNMRCPFCHNASLVLHPGEQERIAEEDFFAFLKKRQGLLDGVCISGGEPCLQLGLEEFIRKIKSLGFLVKLDTNGTFPAELRHLLSAGLLDYVAMDVKNTYERYPETVGVENFDVTAVKESIELLRTASIPYEFRTTVLKNFHGKTELSTLASLLAFAPAYALQAYRDAEDVLLYQTSAASIAGGAGVAAAAKASVRERPVSLVAYSERELRSIFDELKLQFSNLLLRM